MIRLTTRGWSVAVLAGVALALGWWWRYPGLIALGGGFAGLLLMSLLFVAAPSRLSAQRVVDPPQVPRFGRCTSTAEIIHNGRWFADAVSAEDPVDGKVVASAAARLRPGQRTSVGFDIPTHRRGLLSLGPLRLRRLGIAGLAQRTDPVAGKATVRILPRLLPLRALPTGSRRWSAGRDERVAHGGTDLVGMREYLPGDDLRRLHWATSARTGALMVREDADPSHGHVTLVLDDRASSYETAAAFEEAVDIAASITGAASAAGHPVLIRSVTGRIAAEQPGTGTGVGNPAPELLGAFADAGLADVDTSRLALARDLDVLVVIGGSADAGGLALRAGKAALAVALVVQESAPGLTMSISGPVYTLCGPSAEALLRGWDEHLAALWA